MPRAIIFDLDGLMIDSESLARQAWNEMLAPYDVQLSEREYQPLIGKSHSDSIEHVLERTKLDIDPSELDRAFWERMMALIQLDLQPMPGLIPLLDDLRQRELLLGVASNSPVAYVRQALHELQLEIYFPCVRGVDQVRNPKPAPDLYLAAAACLQVSRGECVAIEDSLSGARAALNAEMECLLVPSNEGELDIPEGVRAVFPTLAELHAELEGILAEL